MERPCQTSARVGAEMARQGQYRRYVHFLHLELDAIGHSACDLRVLHRRRRRQATDCGHRIHGHRVVLVPPGPDGGTS